MKYVTIAMLFILILIFSCSDRSSTTSSENENSIVEISGSISGVLESKGTYRVINTIYIDSLSFLEIESGVRIIFADSAYLIVYGNLQSLGTEKNPIIFTSVNQKWKGVKIINATDTSAIVLGTAYGITEGIPIDTHNIRLLRRLGLTRKEEQGKIELDMMKKTPKNDWLVLSHLMVAHGRAICHARKPECEKCVFAHSCPSFGVLKKK